MSIGFAAPIWLLSLSLLPAWWIWLRPRSSDGFVVSTAAAERADPLRRHRAHLIDALPAILRTASVGCLVVALAQPQLVRVVEEPVTEGVAIAFAIDLSTSMWAQDMGRGASRLDVAKSTVRRLLETRRDDVGLVSFAGEALTRVPLTTDPYVVDAAVEGLEVGLLIDGTDIAGAIAAGAGLLKDAPHKSKVLVLVTDGAHKKAGLIPALAARAAAAVGVTIYPISIGQEDQGGRPGMETVLTQAARITGGQYFRATDVETLDMISAEIERLTRPSEELAERTETESLAWWVLLTSLALIVAVTSLRGSRWGVLP